MNIKNFNNARHFAGRLNIGVEYGSVNNYIGSNTKDILATLIPAKPIITREPKLSPWEVVKEFLETPATKRLPLAKQRRKEGQALQAWWLKEIHRTAFPLQERMVIFWHNHFVSSILKIKWPQLMYRQNQLFRQHATGNFGTLLKAIVTDPSMMIYLDGRKNKASSPNENFARELLELFTLGIGYYTETDIINAARALSGWTYNLKQDKVTFRPKQHDAGVKQFLGKQGKFDSTDIINILLDHPRTAEFIAEKCWHEFINHETPEKSTIEQWAAAFRDNNYEIRSLLEAVIKSEAFWSPSNRGVLIKSPIEFTVGMLRECQIDDFTYYGKLSRINAQLGQALFAPPDVKGWRGGKQWINSSQLITRYNLVENLLREDVLEETHDTGNILSSLDMEKISTWLLPLPPVNKPDPQDSREEWLLDLLKDPAYQLR